MEVKSTRDYSLFKHLEGNRQVLDSRVRKIQQSVDNVGFLSIPIIVNERFEVIDGQGRLEVAKRNGLEIHYIVLDGLGMEECESINTNATNWSQADFIKSYADRGNKNFQRVIELYDSFCGYYKVTHVLAACTGKKVCTKEVKDGSLVVTYEMQQKAKETLSELIPYLRKIKDCGSVDTFINGYMFVTQVEGSSKEKVLSVLKSRCDRINSSTIDMFMQTFEDAYNFRKAPSKQINFSFLYQQKQKANKSAYNKRRKHANE